MNIQIRYLYRDAGNFKACGSVTFDNPEGISADRIDSEIRPLLIDGANFIAPLVRFPELRFTPTIPALDHDWHELDCVVECDEPANDLLGRTALDIIACFRVARSDRAWAIAATH